MLKLLKEPCELVPVYAGETGTRSASFLTKNPNGQVPLLELDDGKLLAESNSILLYLAESSSSQYLCKDDLYKRALTYQWLFFEQYTHGPAIAVRRANIIFDRPCSEEGMRELLQKGNKALKIMEDQLAETPFLVGSNFSIADMALFAYTHLSDQGGYDLTQFPNIQAWIQRIQNMPDFCGMDILELKQL